MADTKRADVTVYVGTLTNDVKEGIYRYRLDGSSGSLTFLDRTAGVYNPFYLAADPRGRYLYSANIVESFEGTPGGTVQAFAIDPGTGRLTPLHQQPSLGSVPCYLQVDRAGGHILAGNYGSGSVTVLPIGPDGGLGAATDTVQHAGSSVNRERQECPHVHSFVLDPAGRFAFAADLGLDQIRVYRYDASRGRLTPNDPPHAAVAPGAGPRHLAFHPNGRHAYVINELDNTVTGFAYDAAGGRLSEIQVVPTLPGGYAETSYCADIRILSSGRFLYGSNRGHDSIAVFAVDETTGRLRPLGHEPTQGGYPWNLAIDPSQTFLLAANQKGDSLVTFRIDGRTGGLTPTGTTVKVPKPVCICMLPGAA
jgi:6-phosphogluconolactonase